jgi:hypothetical protein
VLAASGQSRQRDEHRWQKPSRGRPQLDAIDVKARWRLQGCAEQRVEFSVDQFAQIVGGGVPGAGPSCGSQQIRYRRRQRGRDAHAQLTAFLRGRHAIGRDGDGVNALLIEGR